MREPRLGLLAMSALIVLGVQPAAGDDGAGAGAPRRPATPPPPPARQPAAAPGPGGASPGSCPVGMVRVPSTTFRMGSGDEHPPLTMPAYCIDRTEVTVKAYAACVAARGCAAAPRTVKEGNKFEDQVKLWSPLCNREDRPDHPINCVDWDQAVAYCKWAGKRLPTDAEWLLAARGQDGRAYPWGNDAPSATRLNACGVECVEFVRRELKLDWQPMYHASDGWGSTAPVGSFPGGASPFGALDMSGNVAEWTADWYGDYPGVKTRKLPSNLKVDHLRVNRGGSWRVRNEHTVHVDAPSRILPTTRETYLGFRCARGD